MTTALLIKEVNFNGDNLLALQHKTEIYTGVKRVCECVGLTEGQTNRQMLNVQSDLVLSKGVSNLVLPTNGGNQNTLCIMINFLPLWLAKISITPKMKCDNPKLVEKLIDYQLKAKDVLAAAFLPQSTQDIPALQSPSDIALYHLNEAMKSVIENQDKTRKELTHLQQYANDTITALGYDMFEVKGAIEDLKGSNNNKKIERIGQYVEHLVKELSEEKEVNRKFRNSFRRMIYGTPIEQQAWKVYLMSNQEFKDWVNEQIIKKSKATGRLTGVIWKETYNCLVNECGFKCFKNKKYNLTCNLEEILQDRIHNIRITYVLILMGLNSREIKELLLKQV